MDCIGVIKKTVLLDFDGTICFLFKNYNLQNTVDLLSRRMNEMNICFPNTKDAFEVFDEIILQTTEDSIERKSALELANRIITEAEIKAVQTCEPINGVDDFVLSLIENKVPLGIATNNSEKCVEAFLRKYLPNVSIPISGRLAHYPNKMKPNPWSIFELCKHFGVLPADSILIGDSERDFLATKNAGCDFIGLAANERKRKKLSNIEGDFQLVTNYVALNYLLTKKSC